MRPQHTENLILQELKCELVSYAIEGGIIVVMLITQLKSECHIFQLQFYKKLVLFRLWKKLENRKKSGTWHKTTKYTDLTSYVECQSATGNYPKTPPTFTSSWHLRIWNQQLSAATGWITNLESSRGLSKLDD